MPLISAYFDTSVISFLIKKDKRSTEFLTFPYVYSKSILSNQCTQQEFHKYLIEKILLDRKIKIGLCDILISGLMDPPEIPLKTKFSIGAVDIIQNSEDFVPVLLNNCSFITKGVINTFSYCREGNRDISPGKDFGEFNDFANFCIYPQIVPDDISVQSDIDEKIVQKMPSDFKFDSGRKIIFTGGRFAQQVVNRELNYVLMLDVLKGFGAFEVYLDTSNAFLLSRAVQMYDRDLITDVESYIENSGLFIRTGGATECLLNAGVGDDQFIEIEKDKVFVMPLKLENPAKLSIKSNVLGTIDVRTKGGEVGLVFDTRSDDRSLYSDIKLFNDCVKQFGRVGNKN